MNTNPFFTMFGNNGQANGGPLGNLMALMNQFNQFRNTYQGSPQQAQQQVQQMMNNGQISQSQFNQYANIANQLLGAMGQNR